MRSSAVLLLALAILFCPHHANAGQDGETDRLFKELENPEELSRVDAVQKLIAHPDPKVAARLKSTLSGLFDQWSKKATAERSRALKDLLTARKKAFNASAFASKQKETLKLLKKETLEKMETSVREMWDTYYIVPAKCDEDEKVASASARAREYARHLDALNGKGKTPSEDAFTASQHVLDEGSILQVMSERDQKVIKENEGSRTKISPEEYELVLLTNWYRVLMGKNALRLNLKLCAAAKGHSRDMKERNFFDHDSPVPGKRTPQDRAAKQGAGFSGENIAQGTDPFWSWFRSIDHHEGMLESDSDIGVGGYESYWTEMFCR